MDKPRFATFWHGGALSPYELSCLLSFPRRGYELSVYAFEEIANLPSDVRLKDARTIVSTDNVARFTVGGVPSYAHFTDYFRLAIFGRTDEVWVDTDVILLADFDVAWRRNLIGKESPTSLCNAVLRLDPADARLALMQEQIEALSQRKLKWGDTGPRLLTSIYGVEAGLPQATFYPIHFDDYYKVFLPRFRDECEASCANAVTLHLWNNLVVKMGLFKRVGPPPGSFLHAVFERIGTNDSFDLFYPDAVMENLVHNAAVKVGEDAGIRKVIRLVRPAIRSTIARRWPRLSG